MRLAACVAVVLLGFVTAYPVHSRVFHRHLGSKSSDDIKPVIDRLCQDLNVADCDSDADKRAALEFIWRSQHEVDCRRAAYMVVDNGCWGFGGMMGFWADSFMVSLYLGRVHLIRGAFCYARGCPSPTEMCFFHPTTSCSLSYVNEGTWKGPDSEPNDSYRVPPNTTFPLFDKEYVTMENEDGSERQVHRVMVIGQGNWQWFYTDEVVKLSLTPEEFRHKGVPWFRNVALLTRFRLQPTVRAMVDQRMKEMGWTKEVCEKGVISVHVRHGDKMKENFKIYSLDEHFAHVDRISEKTGVTHVFIASDDPQVIDDARTNAKYKRYRIMALDDHKRFNDGATVADVAAQTEDGYRFGLDAVLNIWLLSEGNYFVGIVHSNFGRLGAALMEGKGKARGPQVYLDLTEGCKANGHFHPDVQPLTQLPWLEA